MQPIELRHRFVTQVLYTALEDPTAFYEAFEEGEDALAAYWTSLWESMCTHSGVSMAAYPCFPETLVYILEDTADGFCALVTVTLPSTPGVGAVKAAVVFGSAMDPRLFAAVPTMLDGGETLEIVECLQSVKPITTLYQGCDNGMQLFDPPTAQPIDRTKPLAVERREEAFVDAVVCWCLEHD